MTSRRIISDEKSILEKDDSDARTPAASAKSDIAPAVPAAVILKLLAFTAAMIGLPIGTYFMSLNVVFGGNATWAGASAAIVANVVLIAYVIVAMNEDQSDKMAAEEKAKKGQ